MTQVNKIGRGSISYTKSVIEPIIGALQGLIIVVNSEGGFASLKIQIKVFLTSYRFLLPFLMCPMSHVSYTGRTTWAVDYTVNEGGGSTRVRHGWLRNNLFKSFTYRLMFAMLLLVNACNFV
ncbi:hypothetical protein VPH35_003904 [Triticum aestivum]